MSRILYSLAGILFSGLLYAQPGLKISQAKLFAQALVAKTRPEFILMRTLRVGAVSLDPCAYSVQCSSTPLPVRLMSFSGKRVDNASVALAWETSQEVNNDYFQVEKTLNPSWGFEPAATVKGAGSTSAIMRYQTTDLNDHSGYTYYRLKQVDFNGTFEYSSVIAIKGASVPLSVTAFPNPGQSKNMVFKVNGLKVAEEIEIMVSDTRGSIVYQDSSYPVSPEAQQLKLNLPGLPVGKYSIRIKSKSEQAVSSFVIIP